MTEIEELRCPLCGGDGWVFDGDEETYNMVPCRWCSPVAEDDESASRGRHPTARR